MDPLFERWPEIDALFAAALQRAPAEREAFVRREAGEDARLREILLDLLRAGETSDVERVLEDSVHSVQAEMLEGMEGDDASDEPLIGERIGPYRLVRRLARGGMGTVFLAERDDEHFRQRVALKLLRRGLDTDDIVRRFRAERQILASLAHPNIARLLDGGATDDGRPYLVLEYVDGRPIDVHCDERDLSVEERLRLFVVVARAVQHAHRHLIVHRDIKPSNILVDAAGRVKLVDFGIAKILDPSTQPEDTPHTRTGVHPMTPEYASPEQVAGAPITTASDVYQLGTLLRLLLGSRARGGDLGRIVAMALRPEPERRYGSAGELADDVERHLGGFPVVARGDALGYRIRKFVRRHRSGVAAAAAILLLVVGYAVTATIQAGRLARERDRATVAAARARRVTNFLVGLFEVSDPNESRGRDVTAREVLDAGAERVERELSDQPLVRAELLSAIGRVYAELGFEERARTLLEKALAARRSAPDPPPEEVVRDLGYLAGTYDQSDYDAALRYRTEQLETAERLLGPDHPLVAGSLTDMAEMMGRWRRVSRDSTDAMLARALGILRRAHGDVRAERAHTLAVSAYGHPPEVAAPRMREALEIEREIYGPEHKEVAARLNDLALVLESVAPLRADSLMTESVALFRKLLGERGETIAVMNNLAGLRRDRGDYWGAESLYRRVITIRRELYPDDRFGMAYPLYGLGLTLAAENRPAEAEPLFREAARDVEGAGQEPVVLSDLSRVLAMQGRYAEGEAPLLKAVDLASGPGGDPALRRALLGELADLYDRWGRKEEARRYHDLAH